MSRRGRSSNTSRSDRDYSDRDDRDSQHGRNQPYRGHVSRGQWNSGQNRPQSRGQWNQEASNDAQQLRNQRYPEQSNRGQWQGQNRGQSRPEQQYSGQGQWHQEQSNRGQWGPQQSGRGQGRGQYRGQSSQQGFARRPDRQQHDLLMKQEEEEERTLSNPLVTVKAPSESKRGWVGALGKVCDLIVNYFKMDVATSSVLYRYHVDIQFMTRNDPRSLTRTNSDRANTDDEDAANQSSERKEGQIGKKKESSIKNRMVCRSVLWEYLRRTVPNDLFKFVFDDRTILLSTVDIMPPNSDKIESEFMFNEPTLNDTVLFKVSIRNKSIALLDLQAINLILTQLCRHPLGPLKDLVHTEIDRRFINAGDGFEGRSIKRIFRMRRGLSSAVKTGRDATMMGNYDLKHSIFFCEGISILEYYAMCKRIYLPNDLRALRDFSMNKMQRAEFNMYMSGVVMQATYQKGRGGMHRFLKLHEGTASSTIVATSDKPQHTVEQYFLEKYGVTLMYPFMPLVQVGRTDRDVFIPIELLTIASRRQRLRTKLPEEYQRETTKYALKRPLLRFNIIRNMMSACMVDTDPIAKEFGVAVDLRFLQIEGRVLESVKALQCIREPEKFEQVSSIKLAVVTVDKVLARDQIEDKITCLKKACLRWGLSMTRVAQYDFYTKNLNEIGVFLSNIKKELGAAALAMFVIPDSDRTLYESLKYMGDIIVGLRTQVIKCSTFNRIGSLSMNTNLFRKINNKIGGVNIRVEASSWPEFTKVPTLFLGVDVTHPAPGDTNYPSIAAAVGNKDRLGTSYAASIRIQGRNVESVSEVGEMLLERIDAFYGINKAIPKQIVYFRDGVSESQFDMVVNTELKSMREACLKRKYNVKFTVIIVQKRHSTRFYVADSDPKEGNVAPGTVVDRYITDEKMKQFFMCSHKGLLGTSRPVNYFVIVDESNFSADAVQNCANVLCNIFGRSAGPVALVAPVYYAHLTCFRARAYVNHLRSLGEDVTSLQNTALNPHSEISPYMFFS